MKFLNFTIFKEKVYTLTHLILTLFLLIMVLMKKTFGPSVVIFTTRSLLRTLTWMVDLRLRILLTLLSGVRNCPNLISTKQIKCLNSIDTGTTEGDSKLSKFLMLSNMVQTPPINRSNKWLMKFQPILMNAIKLNKERSLKMST